MMSREKKKKNAEKNWRKPCRKEWIVEKEEKKCKESSESKICRERVLGNKAMHVACLTTRDIITAFL